MATDGLTAHHQDEIKKYLKFFRGKLEVHINALERDFEDTREDRLTAEDMYTQNEVGDVMESLCNAIKSSVRSEFQASINMTALLLQQLFLNADDEDVALTLNTSCIEDRQLLEKVQRLQLDDPSLECAEVATRTAHKKISKMNDERNELEDEIDDLKKEMEELKAENLELKNNVVVAGENGVPEVSDGDNRQVQQLKAKLREAERKCSEAVKQVTESKQFQAMKGMVSTKNVQLRELRSKLLHYEPDNAGAVDDSQDAKATDRAEEDEFGAKY